MPVPHMTFLSQDCVRELKPNVLADPLHVLKQLSCCASGMIEAEYHPGENQEYSNWSHIFQHLILSRNSENG